MPLSWTSLSSRTQRVLTVTKGIWDLAVQPTLRVGASTADAEVGRADSAIRRRVSPHAG